jgi:hypothetical protein
MMFYEFWKAISSIIEKKQNTIYKLIALKRHFLWVLINQTDIYAGRDVKITCLRFCNYLHSRNNLYCVNDPLKELIQLKK